MRWFACWELLYYFIVSFYHSCNGSYARHKHWFADVGTRANLYSYPKWWGHYFTHYFLAYTDVNCFIKIKWIVYHYGKYKVWYIYKFTDCIYRYQTCQYLTYLSMIYVSLAWILIIIWKPYRSIINLQTNYRTRWWW